MQLSTGSGRTGWTRLPKEELPRLALDGSALA